MTITRKQQKRMLKAAKPLIRWLNENCHPHCQAVVDLNSVVLFEGIASHRTDEYLCYEAAPLSGQHG